MKKILFFFLMLPAILFAAPVDLNLAQQVAENFINAPETNAGGMAHKAPRKQKRMARVAKEVTNNQQFYVFNSEDNEGFVIVAADDVVRPVLGYSLTSNLNVDAMPENIKQWLEEYNNQIVWAQQNDVYQDEVKNEWNRLKNNNADIGTIIVAPLLTTTWNQDKYYNSKCPTTWLGILGDDGHVYAGCTACAMAQTMKYWNYPTKGRGSFTNTNNPSYGDLYVNFGNTTYDWQNMPNKLTSSSTSTQINAVATLMYHCGVSLNTDYGYNGSGALPTLVPLSACIYFKYSNLISYIERDKHTLFSWYTVIIRQLDNLRPVMYGGYPASTQKVGHSFVCDGYTSKLYFHFNWGWSGDGNGYFLLDALLPDPSIDGSGAGDYDYRFHQNAIVNFVPDGRFEMDSIQLISDWSLSRDTIGYGESLNATVNICSYATQTFQGNIYAAIVDESGNIVMALDSLMNETLEGGNMISIEFSNQSVKLDAGRYYLTMTYQAGNSVGMIGGDYYSNIIPFYVKDSFHLKSGKYIIVANRDKDGDKNWYYMTSDLGTASNKRFQAVSTNTESLDNIVTEELEDKYIWELVEDGENWKLMNGSNYVTWTSGNSANLDATGKTLTCDVTDNAVQVHFNDGTAERYLSLNAGSSNNYFAFYGNTNQITHLYFLPYSNEVTPEPPARDCKDVPYTETFASSQGEFTVQNVTLPSGFTSIWNWDAQYGMVAKCIKGSTKYESKSYLISPCIELPENAPCVLTFSHAAKFFQNTDQMSLWISTNYDESAPESAQWNRSVIPTYPTGANWNWYESGDIDLSAYSGQAVNIAFCYTSTTSYAPQWEIKNFAVKPSTATLIESVQPSQLSATKVLRNGQLFILRDGKTYSVQGAEIK